MKLSDYFRLWFNKSNCVKVNIYYDDRRYKTVIRKADSDTVTVDGKTYMIKYDLVFFSGSLPTLNYLYNNPEPFNMTTGNIEGVVTPEEINATINNTVYKNMISDMLRGDAKLINTIMIMSLLNILVVGIATYFLYSEIQKISLWMNENQDLIDALRRALIEGVIN